MVHQIRPVNKRTNSGVVDNRIFWLHMRDSGFDEVEERVDVWMEGLLLSRGRKFEDIMVFELLGGIVEGNVEFAEAPPHLFVLETGIR
jgi:hypothetical protein